MKSPIQINNFTKEYKTKVIHINNITISNKVTIFIGENGCGKSTLIKSILHLISYKGEIINNNSLSYMPENPYFPVDITVKEFLFNLSHISKDDYDYNQLLSLFSLESKIDSLISALSKGMKAKLNLVQCLLLDRDIYLLDEPFNGLDKESVDILMKYIEKSTKSYIISTHLNENLNIKNKEIIQLD